jgi:hypothetical protein
VAVAATGAATVLVGAGASVGGTTTAVGVLQAAKTRDSKTRIERTLCVFIFLSFSFL